MNDTLPDDSALVPVSVLVPVPGEVGAETFTYLAPRGTTVGERVEVSFGRRTVIGFVTGMAESREGSKPVTARVDGFPVVTPELMELTRWMARACLVPWYRCLETAVPQGLKFAGGAREKTRRVFSLAPGRDWDRRAWERMPAEDERVRSLVAMLAAHPRSLTSADLMRRFGLSRGRLDTLVRRGDLVTELVTERRDPLRRTVVVPDTPRALTPDQAEALTRLASLPPGGELLLWGVTGSGKTEVYLQGIARELAEGRSAIVLVPEIALTPQTVDRFRARLGDTVAILHSALSPGERYDEWLRILRGQSRVVVGARSAVFAPVVHLGLIVVDEAHEHSFKQGETPRYHAVDVARRRAQAAGARILLGTATPLCEHLAGGAGSVARLERRIGDRPLPPVTVVDMRAELAEGNTTIFSRELEKALTATLKAGRQALLFLNRRGHASFVLCRTCGEAIRCPSCDVTLTPHEYRSGGARGGRQGAAGATSQLVCHFCNHRIPPPSVCPGCGSRKIKAFGAGTERIEAEVRERWPEARVARMDADTTVRKGAHRDILTAFAAGEFDVLVGTQMIGKGLDIPRITLVGVVAAETSLHVPDFRAAERTFSLLVQVLGRAGRAEEPGRAIVQTYQPDHPAVQLAARHDVETFVRGELARRKVAALPPFQRMAQWTVEVAASPITLADDLAAQAAGRIADALRDPSSPAGKVLGPAPAPVERLRGRQRWQVRWLTSPGLAEDARLEALKRASVAGRPTGGRGRAGAGAPDIRILLDIDPVDLM